MASKALTKLSATWLFYIALTSLCVTGLACRFAFPYAVAQHYNIPPGEEDKSMLIETLRGIGEALIVAAILAAVVDPYAKFRLGKEVGREIAKETAGEHLPQKLREALGSMHEITLYMRRMVIECILENVEDTPNLLRWKMTMHYEVENASWSRRPFEHRLTITDEEVKEAQMEILEVGHSVNGVRKYRLKGPDAEFQSMCQKLGPYITFEYAFPTGIQTSRLGDFDKCEYFTTTRRLVPVSEIQVIQFAKPTVGVTLIVYHPRSIKIETSLEHIDGIEAETPDGEIEGEVSSWTSERAYLGNEHLWIMYERQDSEGSQNPQPLPPLRDAMREPKIDPKVEVY